MTSRFQSQRGQRGGFVMGLIVGLLAGLALALGVALYVTKVPVPFVNKVPQRTAEQDAAEAEKNRNWDPNAGLHGKTPAPVAPPPGPLPSGSAPPAGTAASAVAARPAASAAVARVPASAPARDPAALLGERASGPVPTPAGDPFVYFAQAGAYGRAEDAEQQRARLAMLGYEARVTEREQSGRTVYRVRIGPFDRREEAESAKDRLTGAGVESALVRVQK